MTNGFYMVVDCPWNRTNCPELIGQRFENPPSYTAVKSEREGVMEMDDHSLKSLWNIVAVYGNRMIQISDGLIDRLKIIVAEVLAEREIPYSMNQPFPKTPT